MSRFRRRQMLAAAVVPGGGGDGVELPTIFRRVEYLQSDGYAYIDTGFTLASDNSKVECKFAVNSIFIDGQVVFGATSRALEMFTWSNKINGNYCGYNYWLDNPVSDSPMLFEKDGDVLNLYDGDTLLSTYTYTAGVTVSGLVSLFALPRSPYYLDKPSRIYHFKMSEQDGTPICDLYPCYRKSDHTPGMFDLVTRKFFTNANSTGAFICGNDIPSHTPYLVFVDPAVEAICVQNWGDGVGITPAQAAAVTSFGNVFQGNTSIVSFDELQYFTGVTELGVMEFYGCTSLASIDLRNVTRIRQEAFRNCSALAIDINMPQLLGSYYEMLETSTFQNSGIVKVTDLGTIGGLAGSSNFAYCNNLVEAWLPATVTLIGRFAFDSCPALASLVCLATTPPSGASGLVWGNTSVKIYVPYSSDHSILDAYKAASGWSDYASQIYELNPDGTIPT